MPARSDGPTVVVDFTTAAAGYADVPIDEPGPSWSWGWEYGIESRLQVPEIPSPNRMAISIGELENAAKEGTVCANTVRLLGDHRTKESRVSGSNHFQQPNN